ncbi:MAG: hypothetical protein ACKO34_04415 [Vampirovibrionales bacterium]
MGFAASSARLYMLLARKIDLEFQMQQINQARLRLQNVMDKVYATSVNNEPDNPAVVMQEELQRRIQSQEKRLELIMERIRIQYQAITTEIEGLKKLISSNVKASFSLLG